MSDLSKVVILTPVDPKLYVSAPTCRWLVQMARLGIEWFPLDSAYHCAGRNWLVCHALHTRRDATHFCFIDTDIEPPLDAILRLLEVNKDAVSMAYCLPLNLPDGKMEIVWACGHADKGWMPYEQLPGGLFRCDAVGVSALLLRRTVFERIPAPWFEVTYLPHTIVCEDVNFAKKLHRHGFEIWCHGGVRAEHHRFADVGRQFQAVKRAAHAARLPTVAEALANERNSAVQAEGHGGKSLRHGGL